MSNFYQKPAIRFDESPLESDVDSAVFRVYVGAACVGRVEIQPPNDEDSAEDRCWFVTAVYGSSMGQDCEQWKCNDFDEAWAATSAARVSALAQQAGIIRDMIPATEIAPLFERYIQTRQG